MGIDTSCTPVCIGMPRSASRMTWQIVNRLLPQPEWWEMAYPCTTAGPEPWPLRRHVYVDQHVASMVIYTYRNPLEAFLSYINRTEDAQDVCTQQIVEHKEIIEKLKIDQANGRKVLWLKYEDFNGNDRARIERILRFLNLRIAENHMTQMMDYVSINTNLKRSTDDLPEMHSQAVIHGTTFGSWYHPTHGIQANHVNPLTRGEVGAHLSKNVEWVKDVLAGRIPRFKVLGQFAIELGY